MSHKHVIIPPQHDDTSNVVATAKSASFSLRFCKKIKGIYCSTMKKKQPRIKNCFSFEEIGLNSTFYIAGK